MKKDIKLLKMAIKKGNETPFLYTEEEMHTLKKKLRQLKDWHRSTIIAQKEDLVTMYDENFDISWDENDICQAPEDDWVAAVLGSENEVIDELTYAE